MNITTRIRATLHRWRATAHSTDYMADAITAALTTTPRRPRTEGTR